VDTGELATASNVQAGLDASAKAIELDTYEKLVVQGDLSALRPDERLQFYFARCQAAGLDPATQPFEYIRLQGKLVLYAKKTATDQLIAKHKLDVAVGDPVVTSGIMEVKARVRFPDGRGCEDVGAVAIEGLAGVDLANARMRVVTKAKRRAVLSACGLGILDETEVEDCGSGLVHESLTAPATAPAIDNQSGYGSGKYASPKDTDEYYRRLGMLVEKALARWHDRWPNDVLSLMPKSVQDPVNTYQCNAHLLKWCVETGRLDAHIVPADVKTTQNAKFVAVVYMRDSERAALRREIDRYVAEKLERAAEAIYRQHPELAPDDVCNDELPDDFDQTEAGARG
jgi:hypothetical protein